MVFQRGGSLTLEVPNNLQIGGTNPFNTNTLWVPESLFSQGGFSQYTFATTIPESSHILVGDSLNSRTFISPSSKTISV